jgi:exodeoxyribonuclease VII large subunit
MGGFQLDFDLQGGPVKPKPTPSPIAKPVTLAVTRPVEPTIFSVSALTRKVRGILEQGIGEVWVDGEISNLRRQASGHIYFTLKDASSQIACVLFAGQTPQLKGMRFADGVQVRIFGELTVYEARGNYQIIVRTVQDQGEGALQAKFEELKRRLDSEGLFRQERKRPLPKFPLRIGVVTSPTGAAVQDFLNVLHRRQRGIEVIIHPVRVQGKGAAAEIAAAVRDFATSPAIGPVDVIVVTRGGGSLEDLWEFNEEVVARAVAESPIPVVSAVGHEIDFTICDFAADVRAATPSAAAEILSADSNEILEKLSLLATRLHRHVQNRIESAQTFLDSLCRTALFLEPVRILRDHRQHLDRLLEDLENLSQSVTHSQRLALERFSRILLFHSPERRISDMTNAILQYRTSLQRFCAERHRELQSQLARDTALLNALNPIQALARGYTLTLDSRGQILRNASDISPGQILKTRFHDGIVESEAIPLNPTA